MDIGKLNVQKPANTMDYNKNPVEKVNKPENIVKEKPADNREAKVSQEDLKAAVKVANNTLFKNNTHLKFEIHEKTKEVMVRIVSDETGEVVKEIPPEKMLDMVAKLWEIAGILVDEKR